LIYLIFDCKDSVNGDVLHGWKHVLLNVDAFRRIFLVQKLLEELKRNCITDLMSTKSGLVLNLQTVVGQMRHYVIRVDVVVVARSPEVAFIEKMEIKFIWIVLNMDYRPNSNVELPLPV